MKPQKEQEQVTVPLGLNRHVLLGLACIICVINGPVVLNWPPLRTMLVKSDVYAWKCSPDDLFDGDNTCADQRKAIALLGNLGQTMMFVGSVFAGYISDTFGPKVATPLGSIFFALQHIMTAVSSESFQLYIPAFIFAGLGIEMSFFGLISIANLYPRNQALALSIMGTFRSISMAYSIFQNVITVPDKFNIRAMSILCACVALGIGVLGFFILPKENFRLILHKQEEMDDAHLEEQTDSAPKLQLKSSEEQSHHPQEISYVRGREEEQQQQEQIAAAASSISINGNTPQDMQQPSHKELMKQALQLAIRPVYIVWLFYFALAYARGVFYSLSLGDQHPDVVGAYSVLSPLSFIPCPFLGYLADNIGMLWVLMILNTFGSVIFICLVSGSSLAAQWIAVLSSCVLMSFLASQNYCYIAGAYSERMQGKLAGFAMLMAGLVNFVNTPLYNWATDEDHFQAVNYLYVGVSGILYCLLALLVIQRRSTEGYKGSKRETEIVTAKAG